MLRCNQYLRLIGLAMLFCLLSMMPARGDMSISATSSLDTFSIDLEGIHLKLEKLEARWQLSPFGDSKMLVDKVRAKRLIITVNNSTKKTGNSGLPERIKLPFPISIRQAEVAELLVINGETTRTFSKVKFELDADTKSIHLSQLNAGTPWGEAAISLKMETTEPFALSGVASIKQTVHSMPYDVKAKLSGDLNSLQFESTMMLAKLDGKFSLYQDGENKASPAALISAKGKVGLSDNYQILMNASITELRPERLGNYPAAKLNIDTTLEGQLSPEANIELQFATHDSQWQNQTLTGSGKLQLVGTSNQTPKIRNIDFQVALANNNIKANGSLGKTDSRIDWQADLPDLGKLGSEYAGTARAEGTLEGAIDNFALRFNLSAQHLRLPQGIKAAQLEGQAMLMPEENGKVTGEFKAVDLQYGQHPLMDAQLSLQGTKINHRLTIAAQGKPNPPAKSKPFTFESKLHGALIHNASLTKIQWQGMLESLVYDGKTPIKLTAPAPLSFDATGFTLEKANIQLTKGHALIEQIQLSGNEFASKGHLEQLTLDDLPRSFLHLPDTMQGDATFAGQWNVTSNESLNGSLSFWREAGDLTMIVAGGTRKPLRLDIAKAAINISNNQVTLSANISGRGIGNAEAIASTTLTKNDAGYGLLATSPLALTGQAQLTTLAWLPLPTSLMDADIDGEVKLAVVGNGTLKTPNLSGNVIAKNLQFSLPTEGVTLKEGTLEANFENDKLSVKQASWRGGDGFVKTSGVIRLEKGKPTVDLAWNADKFTVISRADRLLVLSGTGNTTLADDLLTISGDFTVNKGLAELANEDTPILGDDVVILDQTDTLPEPALRVLLNGLRIRLGDAFKLRGRGLDAELTGALSFTGLTQYRPHTEGSIQVKSGTYMAYGQVLTIERGILNFNGTVDNPGVNFRAMRNSKPVNAGVEITGSAQYPATKLVSDPTVADSEKLSWLVLGHGMDQTTKNDYGLLSLAAGAILSQGQSVPLQTQLARAAGLDELNFSGGDASSASLVFGKRLTSRLYLNYVKSISGLLDVARLTYNVTSRWSVRAEAGTESAVDVLYTFSFK